MTSPLPSDPAARAARKWLDSLLRDGGFAAVLPLVLPLLSGALLLLQAGVLAHMLHRAISAGDAVAALMPEMT